MVHRTGHCSLSGACHVSKPLEFGAVDRWSLLSSCCTGQSSASWLRNSNLWLLHYALLLFIAVDRWVQLTVAPLAHRTLSGAHRTVRWIIAEQLPKNPESGQFASALAWTPDSVRCATVSTNACLCSKLCWVHNLFSLLVCVELYALVEPGVCPLPEGTLGRAVNLFGTTFLPEAGLGWDRIASLGRWGLNFEPCLPVLMVCFKDILQPRLGVLGVLLIMVPDSSPRASKGV
jgi:hypothetical protein